MATSPASVATAHPAHLLVFAALRLHLRSQRSLTLHVRRPTHPMAHWPSWWLNQAVPLAARPLPPLLCLFDTIPSSSSCFRTSLLVYHLLPVISKYLAEVSQWIFSPPDDTCSGGSGGRTLLPRRAGPAGLEKALCTHGAILKACVLSLLS